MPVMQCSHCGHTTLLEVRAECRQHSSENFAYKVVDGEVASITWRILECPQCGEPTFEQTLLNHLMVWNTNGVGHYEVISAEKTILYPIAKTKDPLANLPTDIEKRYMAAFKVQNIEPSACAVLVGRTIEAVCNHENATGKSLSDKLNNLVSSARIPKTLADMAHQLRQIRNLGAHDAEDEVTEEDIPIIMDFLEAILEYLYVAPAKIAKLQARFNKTL